MEDDVKRFKALPSEWNKIWNKTLGKRISFNKLNDDRVIVFVPFLSVTSDKLHERGYSMLLKKVSELWYNQVILAVTLTGVQSDIRCKVLAAISTVT